MTKEAIHFAFQGEDLEIDHIPLDEIERINATASKESDLGAELNGKEPHATDHAIHITTEQGGHNSGRAYYVRADSKGSLDRLIQCVQSLACEAKKRRDNRGIFQRAQLRVRRVYESAPSRALILLLIALVKPVSSGTPCSVLVVPRGVCSLSVVTGANLASYCR